MQSEVKNTIDLCPPRFSLLGEPVFGTLYVLKILLLSNINPQNFCIGFPALGFFGEICLKNMCVLCLCALLIL